MLLNILADFFDHDLLMEISTRIIGERHKVMKINFMCEKTALFISSLFYFLLFHHVE